MTIEQRVLSLPGGFAADWTMTFVDSETGKEYMTIGADDVDAARPEAAAYWAEVADAQEQALEYEDRAKLALNLDDLDLALQHLRDAAQCEHPEGSGGTYDALIQALEGGDIYFVDGRRTGGGWDLAYEDLYGAGDYVFGGRLLAIGRKNAVEIAKELCEEFSPPSLSDGEEYVIRYEVTDRENRVVKTFERVATNQK